MNKQTIQQFLDSGDTYSIWCHNPRCGHHAKLDMVKLRDKLGPDHGSLHDDIIHLFRCSKCGGKELGLQRHPKGVGFRQERLKGRLHGSSRTVERRTLTEALPERGDINIAAWREGG